MFAYINRKFSSREIERACKTDIRFMWLLGGEPAPIDYLYNSTPALWSIDGEVYEFDWWNE